VFHPSETRLNRFLLGRFAHVSACEEKVKAAPVIERGP
jgi:hypothetical protein